VPLARAQVIEAAQLAFTYCLAETSLEHPFAENSEFAAEFPNDGIRPERSSATSPPRH